jgi:hypothetical protein
VAAALDAATGSPSLIHATRDAFTNGTGLGLRIGVALLVVTSAAAAHHHPKED